MKNYQIDENGVVSPNFYSSPGAPIWPIWACIFIILLCGAVGWWLA